MENHLFCLCVGFRVSLRRARERGWGLGFKDLRFQAQVTHSADFGGGFGYPVSKMVGRSVRCNVVILLIS